MPFVAASNIDEGSPAGIIVASYSYSMVCCAVIGDDAISHLCVDCSLLEIIYKEYA
jgi:hypothetical protein